MSWFRNKYRRRAQRLVDPPAQGLAKIGASMQSVDVGMREMSSAIGHAVTAAEELRVAGSVLHAHPSLMVSGVVSMLTYAWSASNETNSRWPPTGMVCFSSELSGYHPYQPIPNTNIPQYNARAHPVVVAPHNYPIDHPGNCNRAIVLTKDERAAIRQADKEGA